MLRQNNNTYNAIGSAQGKIRKLMVSFDGTAHGKAFLKDIFTNFPDDIELLIWITEFDHPDRMVVELIANNVNRKNYQILPSLSDYQDADIIKENLQKRSAWIRDIFYILQNEGRWKILSNDTDGLIPFVLKKRKIVEVSGQANRLPAFGNFLIDSEFLILEKMDIRGPDIPSTAEFKKYILSTLFGGVSKPPKIISIGPNTQKNEAIPSNDIFKYFKHTDLYLTLTGLAIKKAPIVMLGKLESPQSHLIHLVQKVEEQMLVVKKQLTKEGFMVLRNPIPLIQLQQGVLWVGYYNNCIVEVAGKSRKAWLPKFEHPDAFSAYLALSYARNKAIWESLGFRVSAISGGMMEYSSLSNGRGGALHCLLVEFRS